MSLSPQPLGGDGRVGSPNTVTRENEFHFSKSGSGSCPPFTHCTRSSEAWSAIRRLFPATKAASSVMAINDPTCSRTASVRARNTPAAVHAMSAVPTTVVGPSVTSSATTTMAQPAAAPSRSTA